MMTAACSCQFRFEFFYCFSDGIYFSFVIFLRINRLFICFKLVGSPLSETIGLYCLCVYALLFPLFSLLTISLMRQLLTYAMLTNSLPDVKIMIQTGGVLVFTNFQFYLQVTTNVTKSNFVQRKYIA